MKPLPVFLDRDGVINENRDDYVKSLSEWVPIEGAMEAIAALSEAGHPVVVVTNQSAVARGYCGIEQVKAIHSKLMGMAEDTGGIISSVYYCPHHPNDGCRCRKPATGMILRARKELDLPDGGYMVGDAASDMELGERAGLKTVLVLTGRGEDQLEIMESGGDVLPWRVADDITEACRIILDDSSGESHREN
ncbi:MAG: D-glycero-beta-D-manno-heptose 1,7-bisphosphate 7-phosphatase [Candidatus Aegiribacteria sp.]|nr:D-glycero-beta-D-manno-heptose 1,7-bisphosphate 7-phosphatase [Candidatus Aegiribacteria sp.]MBD3294577.1 D-glycero-beta-D-manno-heptose 1,7-bisphosphate 7-phosphatase [Candidatus Fermentibacteria bacterium]